MKIIMGKIHLYRIITCFNQFFIAISIKKMQKKTLYNKMELQIHLFNQFNLLKTSILYLWPLKLNLEKIGVKLILIYKKILNKWIINIQSINHKTI